MTVSWLSWQRVSPAAMAGAGAGVARWREPGSGRVVATDRATGGGALGLVTTDGVLGSRDDYIVKLAIRFRTSVPEV